MIYVNIATADELASLPKIGPAIAQKIVQDRKENGRFTNSRDFLRVAGISEHTLLALRGRISYRIPNEVRNIDPRIAVDSQEGVPALAAVQPGANGGDFGANARNWLDEVKHEVKQQIKARRPGKKKRKKKRFSPIDTTGLITPELINRCAAELKVPVQNLQLVFDAVRVDHGRIKDGRASLTFNGELLWFELKRRGLKIKALKKSRKDVLYSTHDESLRRKGAREYDRLDGALQIHPDAAMMASSWGMMQVLGVHYKKMGYPTVYAFATAQHNSEAQQFIDFLLLMKHKTFRKILLNADWNQFGVEYFGKHYKRSSAFKRLKKAARKISTSNG